MNRVYIIQILLNLFISMSGQHNPTGIYFGQEPPGDIPEVFADGFISTRSDEIFGTFSPDLEEFYFIRINNSNWKILCTKKINDKWTIPEEAPFSGIYASKFCISPDGKKVFLTSLRPSPGAKQASGTTTWISERKGDKWSDPVYVPGLDGAYAPSLASSGNLYFHMTGESQQDIFVSKSENGNYSPPVKLSHKINSQYDEADPWIAPDESYILFSREHQESTVLFISYKSYNGWTEAIPLGNDINSIRPVNAGSLTPDGKYIMLFAFSTNVGSDNKQQNIDIYWASSSIINRLIPGKIDIDKFLPGIISVSGKNEGNLTYSSKYKTYLYRRFDQDENDPLTLISFSKKRSVDIYSDNLTMDSKFREWDFNFNRDGDQFYFTSDRPLNENDSVPLSYSKIWQVSYRNGKWGRPFILPYPVNIEESFSGYPGFTNNKTMYFHSNRQGGYGGDDIYSCISSKNSFTQLSHPPYPINTGFNDRDPAISPDGSVLIFFSDRPGGSYADGDLYICSRNKNCEWNRPMPLGGLIGYAGHPYISDDGESLFITKPSGTDTDIYKVSLEELQLYYSKFSKLHIESCSEEISAGRISTADNEVPIKTAQNNILVFSRTPTGFTDWLNEPIFYSRYSDNEWSIPEKLENKNGNWVRDLPPDAKKEKIAYSKWIECQGRKPCIDIFLYNNSSSGTDSIKKLPFNVNTEFIDSWPTMDARGNLYFFSNRPWGHGGLDLYYSSYVDGSYSKAKNLGPAINSYCREHDPAVSPDGSILIFASDRKGGFGGDDLYICFKNQYNEWTPPLNLGSDINTGADENRPVFNQEGDSIFFASNTSGNLDILKISLK